MMLRSSKLLCHAFDLPQHGVLVLESWLVAYKDAILGLLFCHLPVRNQHIMLLRSSKLPCQRAVTGVGAELLAGVLLLCMYGVSWTHAAQTA